jgi:hypothetical protein
MTNAMGTRFSMAPPVAVQNKLYERPQPAKRSPPLAAHNGGDARGG